MALRGPPGDPRAVPLGPAESDVRPVVGLPRSGLPGWAIAAVALLAGLILFAVLDARRRAPSTPEIRVRASDTAAVRAPPPPLYLPPEPAPQVMRVPVPAPPPPAPAPAPPQIIYVPQPMPEPAVAEAPPPPPRTSTEPAVVVDTGAAPAAGAAESDATASAAPIAGGRARAGMFANRSTTVVQGTLIPAVLETALDFDPARPCARDRFARRARL